MSTSTIPSPATTPAGGSPETQALRRQARTRRSVQKVIFHTGLLAATAVVLYPALWMFMSALKPSNQIIGNVSLLPEDPSWTNFSTALEGIGGVSFWTFLLNSTILAVLTVVGILVSCSLSAYALARLEFPGRNIWFAIMIGTLLLPFHVVIIPQYIVFNELGLVNTFVPLLVGKFLATDAFFVFLMVQFMRNLPRELDEAARGILQLASPFDPFPPDLARDYRSLRFAYEWRFEGGRASGSSLRVP